MKARVLLLAAIVAGAMPLARGAEGIDASIAKAALDYTQKLREATEELTSTREKIAVEKAPILEQIRTAQERVIALEAELGRLRIEEEHGKDRRRDLAVAGEAVRKNLGYFSALAQDGLKALESGFAPGESPSVAGDLSGLQQRLEAATTTGDVPALMTVPTAYLRLVQVHLGGYRVPGHVVASDSHELRGGMLAFVGPETLFRSDDGAVAGTVRVREGTGQPMCYPLPGWAAQDATSLFAGRQALVPLDPTGGKALRLAQTRGNIWRQLERGGVMGYAIIVVGFGAIGLIGMKVRDLLAMKIGKPALIADFLARVAAGDRSGATRALETFGGATRELLTEGVRHLGRSREQMEENLAAVLLRQRAHFERRLPLLAVIATASPLMGLLGTVMGMVKTFSLITVFGTGNAGKLSGGISEILIATELGLLVAIPALVAHGFLSHRIHRNMSLLEQYAVDLVNADIGARPPPAGGKESTRA
jgi:biopolymer transport protein ExbB